MLGEAQRQWLIDGVASSTAIWDVVAQQVFMFGGNAVVGAEPPIVVVDTWDGYAGERQLVLDAIGAAADNLVVLTGDFHSAAVADLRADPFDLTLPVLGTEFMASSISSSFFDDDATIEALVSDALDREPADQVVRQPTRLHGVRGHARSMAGHVPSGRRPVRRGFTGRDRQLVGGRGRQSRCRRTCVTTPRAPPACQVATSTAATTTIAVTSGSASNARNTQPPSYNQAATTRGSAF